METNLKNQIKVGIFVLIGILFTMGSIFMLGANKSLFSKFAHIYAEFDNVQGLARGSVVSLSGVVIGNIESIDFVKEKNLLKVDMKIEKEFLPRVFQGSEVEIRTQGALGDKYIYILPGDPRAIPVSDEAILPVAKATDLFNVISERGKETEQLFDIISEIHKLIKSLNQDNNIPKLVFNMSEASKELKNLTQKANILISDIQDNGSTSKQIKGTVEKLNHILTKVDKGEGTLGALINDTSLHDQLKAFLGGSQKKNQIKSIMRSSIQE